MSGLALPEQRPFMPKLMSKLIHRSVLNHVPLNVHFDLTYRCNERCHHCYLDHQDHGELNTEEARNVLQQLKNAGSLFLTFSGGEVFVRQDWPELFAFARHLRFDLNIKTNGTAINERVASQLKEMGARRVQVSLYSADPVVHDGITRLHGSFDRTVRAIRLLKSRGIVVSIACPIMKDNVLGYRDLVAFARKLEVSYVLDLTISPAMNGDMEILHLREGGRELMPIISDPQLRRSCDSEAQVSPLQNSAPEPPADVIPCSAGHNSCYISPYGDVCACVQIPITAGNLRKQTFEEIWFRSNEFVRLRRTLLSDVRVCSSCAIRAHCTRCPGLAYMEDGDINGPSMRACELAEIEAEIAGSLNPISAFRAQRK